jgi:hypothetical protein
MLTSDEISRSTGAAVALFRGDPQGLRMLDVSHDGFWRSFQVFFILLPFIGVMILSERSYVLARVPFSEETFPSEWFVLSRLFGFAIDWIAFPVVLAFLARPLGLERRYVPLVVALNWAALVAAVPAVVPHLLQLLGLISEEMTALLQVVALGIVLRYQYMVTRIATGVTIGFAIGLVALNFILTVIVSVIISSAFGL